MFNYLADVNSSIQGHDEITIDNGLALNAKYKQLLEDLRTKFEQMLQAVKEKYAANELLLDKLRNHSVPKNPSTRNASIYICGAPYFKDTDLSPGPSNKDYIYRRNVKKEFFPIDYLSLPKRFWTSKDKQDIVKGVKEQIVNQLRAGNSSNISEIRNTQKCSRSTSKRITNMRESTIDLEKKPFPHLYKMVEHINFKIDWNKISFKNLDSRHYPNECMAMWNHYLKPGLNHGLWTEKEDEKLQDAIIRHNYQDWCSIADSTNKRSPMQCFVHYRIALSESAQVKRHEKFTQFEDHQLLELVSKYSDGDIISWSKVCQQMPGRNRYQCYHRYMFTIKPGIKRDRFSMEEDCVILAYVHAHGENFGKMPPNLLPGRTPVQIRNRYNNTLKVMDNTQWTVEEDQNLVSKTNLLPSKEALKSEILLLSFQMDFVDTKGTGKWAEFAKIVGTKTRFACRCRYSTIQKYLARNPDAEVKDVPRKDKGRSTMVNLENYLETASKLKASREDPTKAITTDKASQKILCPINKKERPMPGSRLFSDKLGKQLCQYFKYSFNWEFSPERIPRLFSAEDTERTFTMLQLLDFELDFSRFQTHFTRLTTEDQTNLTLALNVEASNQVKDDIRYVKSFGNKLPINLNTVLAWRAMQMMVAGKPLVKTERPQFSNFARRYNLFMRRFKQIFYWTALLSKLDFRIVKERVAVKTSSGYDFNVTIENEAVCSDVDDELVEISCPIEQETVLDSESDEENAVDFLLSHIKNKSIEQVYEEADFLEDQGSVLDMPRYFHYEEDITIEETSIKSEDQTTKAEKRKNELPMTSKEFKKPKRVATAKSMPLT